MRVARPKLHRFLLARREYENGHSYGMTKTLLASFIDANLTEPTREYLLGVERELALLDKHPPDTTVLARIGLARAVREGYDALLEGIRRFKRQHEGYISLNEVALRYRDEQEQSLMRQYDDLWTRWADLHEQVKDIRENNVPESFLLRVLRSIPG
ncbi:hypothetical protein F4818DRAFT_440441 [Hypoxylon cercidicola]|nr:hypothetical protein F4818DRAFT_440441 [Hypoxylon cercidicola]